MITCVSKQNEQVFYNKYEILFLWGPTIADKILLHPLIFYFIIEKLIENPELAKVNQKY